MFFYIYSKRLMKLTFNEPILKLKYNRVHFPDWTKKGYSSQILKFRRNLLTAKLSSLEDSFL